MKSKKKSLSSFASSFWYTEPDFDTDVLSGESTVSDVGRLHKLVASKRAIANFVRIVVPDKNIKTTFKGDQSYTNGDSVTIGADVDNISKFDSAVGLALHEAAHIKLSDFGLLKQLDYIIPNMVGITEYDTMVEKSTSVGIPSWAVNGRIKEILNYVEDRRIDQYIYDTAPGYRDYYQALYDKYFNDKVITKALKSDEFTDESYESYSFRLINIHSDGSRLNALSALPQIWKVLNLKNINRLQSSEDALRVAIQIYQLIIQAVTPPPSENESESSENGTESGGSGNSQQSQSGDNQSSESSEETEGGESGDESSESSEGEGSNTTESKGDGDENNDSDEKDESGESGSGEELESSTSDEPKEALTPNQKRQMGRKIQKQKDFLNGDVKKKNLSKKDGSEIQSIETSNSELVEVGEGRNKSNCIVIRNVTPEFAKESPVFRFYQSTTTDMNEAVARGIRMGKLLASKLQLRSNERTTEYNRLRSGKIDRRMLSGLGFGQTNVFYTKETDSYNNANLHISIDGSSSMGGKKWYDTITATVAILKATDSIQGIDVQVSIRGTHRGDSVMAIVYDSRKDKFKKVTQLFPHLYPSGLTPEGLAFESIISEMVQSGNGIDSIFLNISDGQPYFPEVGFGGDTALNYTRKQVEKIRSMGINVLSYFVHNGDGYYYSIDDMKTDFQRMYGSSAKMIDTNNVSQIARTMNETFLQK